ncbi:type I-C CRISPR-associated protein Cas7/Csd2 [Geomicrobium sp. JCM 19038]|uniref:type I-C CRISPR-associated protein Cas7/Csd2 n=1 Tax=Geomicrobium sp. JCM 19038 TaxID=1460635 RepID=UPI00045F4296|nr:type I-C CRISPR-associated protein Cas7/Csd2 [Geomicrobium sp. JCM 19038]GAK07089.1 CRISPR-associated protein, Csd2 family [Geomicrobium sp. JCM 19038]
MTIYTDTTKRQDFMYLYDVSDGNPNGCPDANNLPRIDYETNQGLMTDVAIKRKIRDAIALTNEGEDGYNIYVRPKGILTREQEKAFEHLSKKESDQTAETKKDARAYMCEKYYDVRMFGAVMNTKKYNCGQVRGPVQLTFARSVDPVTPIDLSITRVALTNATDTKKGSEDDTEARSGQMGRKAFIPYGLYVCYGYFTPAFAEQTGVSSRDLKLFFESLTSMWDYDHSASRGRMACRGLYVFSHDHKLGNAPSDQLFDQIQIQRTSASGQAAPRSYKDYEVKINERLPEGVTLTKVVDRFESMPLLAAN